jgi:hypothetical protein
LDADSAVNLNEMKRRPHGEQLPPIVIQNQGESSGPEQDHGSSEEDQMIRKLKSGQYRLYSRKKNPKTGRRRNLGTFKSRAAAEKHERAVQYFKHH